jgi:hypothetical protein
MEKNGMGGACSTFGWNVYVILAGKSGTKEDKNTSPASKCCYSLLLSDSVLPYRSIHCQMLHENNNRLRWEVMYWMLIHISLQISQAYWCLYLIVIRNNKFKWVGSTGKLLTNSVAPEPEGSSPHSQQPANGPSPETGGYTPPPSQFP